VTVFLPQTVSEACDLLAAHENAVPVAGGTDLFVHWPLQHDKEASAFVDLSAIQELRPLRWTEEEMTLGGLTTYWDVIQDPLAGRELPLLVRAARQVGAIQIQTRGTWAGNIVNASPAADGVAVLMAYDAVVRLRSQDGEEEVPLSDFYLGYKSMRRDPSQLLTWIRIPRRHYDFQMFEKVGSRAAQAITKVGVAVTRSGSEWRIVANSVAPTVCRCRALESLIGAGQPVESPDDLLGPIREDVSPIDDIRSTARYRETVLARLLYFGLRDECPAFT
jgi:CO/xanthine dehydrogenase FAD-binding subunit